MLEFYRSHEDLFAKMQLILFMLGMGPGLVVRDFYEVVRKPRSFVCAFVTQMLLLPFVAELLTGWFRLEEGFALGLILVSAMPGGTLSKVFTYLGRGNIPLSISLTFFSTLATVVTVPATLKLLAGRHVPEGFSMPVAEIAQLVGLYLLLPLAGGMLVARLFPEYKNTFAKVCIRIGFAVIVFIIFASTGSGQIKPFEPPMRVPGAIILFCLLGMQFNMLPFRIMGWPRADCFSAGIEATMRNMNLALLLKTVLFPSGGQVANDVLYVILFYAAAAMVAGLPLALNFRRMARNEARAKAIMDPAVNSTEPVRD